MKPTIEPFSPWPPRRERVRNRAESIVTMVLIASAIAVALHALNPWRIAVDAEVARLEKTLDTQ